MKKVTLSFDSMWVLSRRSDDILPVQAFINALRERYELDVVASSLTQCELIIKNSDADETSIQKTVFELLKVKFDLGDAQGKVTCRVEDHKSDDTDDSPSDLDWDEFSRSLQEAMDEAASAPAAGPAPVPTPQVSMPFEADGDAVEKIRKRIDALVGVPEFKQLAEECIRLAPGLLRHNTAEVLINQSYLFAVNDGYGLTTYLELLADLFENLGLFHFHSKDRVVEEKAYPPQERADADPFAPVKEHFRRQREGRGRIICVDISEWMTKTGDKVFRDFLKYLDDQRGKNILVFRVPFVEKEIVKGLKNGLGDLLFVRDITFVPFNNEELLQCAGLALAKRGYTMAEDAWDVLSERIAEEKSDGRFYGINTIEKIICEMLYRKQLDNAISGVDDTIVKRSEILGLAAAHDADRKTGLDMLDEYVGMGSIKERVTEIVAQIEMAAGNQNLGSPCIHMRFVGNPGTGKTTVARVIGKILKEKGILRNGSFFEYAGRDFCGRYIGETAPKTAAICRDAYGSVLFIDEAYSLYRGDGFSKADYGREAIDTLIAEMENHRTDLVVIMAGYPDEMKDLMKANAGLESRMPYLVEFPNYTREQLTEIFMLMTRKSFTCGEGFEDAVKAYFEALPDELLKSKEFSNARFVRNLFERTWAKAVLRSQINKGDSSVLTKEDFLLASGEKEFSKMMKKQNRTLGFV